MFSLPFSMFSLRLCLVFIHISVRPTWGRPGSERLNRLSRTPQVPLYQEPLTAMENYGSNRELAHENHAIFVAMNCVSAVLEGNYSLFELCRRKNRSVRCRFYCFVGSDDAQNRVSTRSDPRIHGKSNFELRLKVNLFCTSGAPSL